MRLLAIIPLLSLLWMAVAPPEALAREREMTFTEARQIALLVARHDHIQVNDRSVVLNSMDTRREAGFLPGYYSFSIIQESDSAMQADNTIRMYAISKRTGETWELNLCNRYSFPALEKMQQAVMRETGATEEEDPNMPKEIGCTASNQPPSRQGTAMSRQDSEPGEPASN